MSALVSIVVPAFNEERWLPGCLSSLAKQTYPHKEIIVVDDGSTDKTPEISRSFSTKVIRHQTPLGEMRSRNDGIKEAQGEFVLQVDADGVYPEHFVERAVAYFAEDPTLAGLTAGQVLVHPERKGLISDYWRIKRASSYALKLKGKKKKEPGCHIGKKEAFLAVGGYDERLAIGDLDLAKRMVQKGYKLTWVKDLFFWHADPESLKHTLKRVWMQSTKGKLLYLRYNMWPRGSRLFLFVLRNVFVSLLPLYIILAFVHVPLRILWIALALAAAGMESVAPIMFHAEMREMFLTALRQKKYLLALLLPTILFLQLRVSAYSKLYALLSKDTKITYHTDY